jgi:hypothetical protein
MMSHVDAFEFNLKVREGFYPGMTSLMLEQLWASRQRVIANGWPSEQRRVETGQRLKLDKTTVVIMQTGFMTYIV